MYYFYLDDTIHGFEINLTILVEYMIQFIYVYFISRLNHEFFNYSGNSIN